MQLIHLDGDAASDSGDAAGRGDRAQRTPDGDWSAGGKAAGGSAAPKAGQPAKRGGTSGEASGRSAPTKPAAPRSAAPKGSAAAGKDPGPAPRQSGKPVGGARAKPEAAAKGQRSDKSAAKPSSSAGAGSAARPPGKAPSKAAGKALGKAPGKSAGQKSPGGKAKGSGAQAKSSDGRGAAAKAGKAETPRTAGGGLPSRAGEAQAARQNASAERAPAAKPPGSKRGAPPLPGGERSAVEPPTSSEAASDTPGPLAAAGLRNAGFDPLTGPKAGGAQSASFGAGRVAPALSVGGPGDRPAAPAVAPIEPAKAAAMPVARSTSEAAFDSGTSPAAHPGGPPALVSQLHGSLEPADSEEPLGDELADAPADDGADPRGEPLDDAPPEDAGPGLAKSAPEPGSIGAQATPWPRHRGRLPTRPPTPQQVEAKAASDAALEAREAEGDEPDPELAKRPLPSEDELLEALTWAFQGEEVPSGLLPSFARHARLVLEANRQLNLTAIIEAREVAVKHYLDSWRATRLLPMLGKHVVDLGSGAGFPGMPAALGEPNCRVTLVETRKKKADFLEQSIRQLGLKNARAVWARGEDFLATQRCDVVFIRALSSVRENVRMLRKVRHSFMDLILFKGPSWSREVRASEREAERLGFRLDTVWEHELPGGMGQRALLVYRSPSAH
jgi:16S rRNA (guanine527-N7)-methyltransferase